MTLGPSSGVPWRVVKEPLLTPLRAGRRSIAQRCGQSSRALSSTVPVQRGPRLRVVEDRLGRARRIPVAPPWHEHDEHAVAARDRPLDDLAVVRRSRNDGDASLERVELPDPCLPAHADHVVAPVQRVLHHVPPELPGGPDDADLPRSRRPRHADAAVNRPPVEPFVVCVHRFSPGHRVPPLCLGRGWRHRCPSFLYQEHSDSMVCTDRHESVVRGVVRGVVAASIERGEVLKRRRDGSPAGNP